MAKSYVCNENPNYEIKTSEEDISSWIALHPEKSEREYVETLVVQAKVACLLAKHSTFIIHGSSVYLDDIRNGYAFIGPSGVGKSTHVQKLKDHYKDRLSIINDDKPFIDKEYNLYGSPWNGKAHLSSNVNAKLRALFVIYQSKANKIDKLSPSDALSMLVKQIHLPKGIEESNKGLTYLINLSKDIPIYHLGLNLEDDSINNTVNIMEG